MAGIDLRTYVLLERSFVRRLQRSWQQKSAPTYEAIAKACTDHQWDEARRLVQDLDLTEVGTENREWITYMLLSCAVFGANIVAKKAPSFVGVGSFDTFLKQTVNNFLQYLEYSGTSQVQAEALQSIAEDEAKSKAVKRDVAGEARDDKGKWTRKPEGLGGIAKKFDAALHPRGDDGRFVEATSPRIFNRPEDVGTYTSWGEKKWSWIDKDTGKPGGALLTGEPIPRENLPETLYHVTTAGSAVEESGVLLGGREGGGLGGGQAEGVSFTSSKEDAQVIHREMVRAVRIARGEDRQDAIERYAREDEKSAGLPKGSLQEAVDFAMSSWGPNAEGLTKTFVWDEKLPEDKRGWVGPPPSPEEHERLYRGLVNDAIRGYLQVRESAAEKAAGHAVESLKNPLLMGDRRKLAKLNSEDVKILEIPSTNIPTGALVTTGSDKFLHEVRAYSDVPLKKLQSIAKFDSTEPRDDKGRWEKVPGESLDAQDKGLVTERLKKLVSGEVYIGDAGGTSSRLTARVGSQVADVLEEMRAKGYSLPEDVAVYTTEARTPSGLTTEYVADEDTPRHSKGSSWRSLTIDMPGELPPYADLDKVARLAFSKNEGEYSVHSMKDIIIHEMGHVQAQHQESLDVFLMDHPKYTTERAKGAMERVSRYAMRNPDEFVAEAFTRMYRGEKLHPESMKLYKIWHGPEIRS